MKKNGNGRSAGMCPHGCSRCRAIEAGLAGRPLEQKEFILVSGGLIEPSREGRVQWSQKTLDAALAADVAQVAFEDAQRTWVETGALVEAEKAKLRVREGVEDRPLDGKYEEALHTARADLEEASERLRACRSRYHELAARDSYRHGQAGYEADMVTQEATRQARKTTRRGALTRLRGRG